MLLHDSKGSKIKLHHLYNRMNKLLKYDCLLESWYAHINRFFFSLQRTPFIFSVANELRLKMNELFKSNMSPLAPAYVAGYQ